MRRPLSLRLHQDTHTLHNWHAASSISEALLVLVTWHNSEKGPLSFLIDEAIGYLQTCDQRQQSSVVLAHQLFPSSTLGSAKQVTRKLVWDESLSSFRAYLRAFQPNMFDHFGMRYCSPRTRPRPRFLTSPVHTCSRRMFFSISGFTICSSYNSSSFYWSWPTEMVTRIDQRGLICQKVS